MTQGVVLTVQRMVDGMVSGIVYTRHPLTGDGREWLVRSGYGLASAVRARHGPQRHVSAHARRLPARQRDRRQRSHALGHAGWNTRDPAGPRDAGFGSQSQ